MANNTRTIRTLIRELANKPEEIVSGTVVAGSINASTMTMSVLPTGSADPIAGVLLQAISENSNGVILFPKDGSDVVIGSIDGPGEWCMINASEITKARVTIGQVVLEMDDGQVNVKNGHVVFNMSDNVFTMKTQSESLFGLLKDCFSYLAVLTVPTPSGTSGVPVNVADFINLQARLNNLLNG